MITKKKLNVLIITEDKVENDCVIQNTSINFYYENQKISDSELLLIAESIKSVVENKKNKK